MVNTEKIRSKFRKVKQLIVEKTGQSKEYGKTSVLAGQYSQINVDYEPVRKAMKSTISNLESSVKKDTHTEFKRTTPLNNLAVCIVEDLDILENSVLANVLRLTGNALKLQADLATKKFRLVKEQLIMPIKEVQVNVFDKLQKNKKELNDARLNMDECKIRLINTKKSAASMDQLTQAALDKIKAVESEFSVITQIFFIKEENMAYELIYYLAHNSQYSKYYLDLMENEYQYHKECLEIITRQTETINDIFSCFSLEPVFGMSLEKLHEKYGQEISVVIESCLKFLFLNGCFSLEGIFRVAASSQAIKAVKRNFDSGIFDLSSYKENLRAVTGALKLYLSELPESLFPEDKGEEIVSICSLKSVDRLIAITKILTEIPEINAKNILYLVSFLYILAKYEKTTKMSASNLAIVIGPNLLRSDDESKTIKFVQASNAVLTDLITYFPKLYPEWCEYNEFDEKNLK